MLWNLEQLDLKNQCIMSDLYLNLNHPFFKNQFFNQVLNTKSKFQQNYKKD